MRRAVLVGLILLGTGCGGETMAAPPVSFCGQTLYAGAMGLPVYRPPMVPGSHVNAIFPGSSAGSLLVQVSAGCTHGGRFVVAPAGLVSVEKEVKARDGLPVAVELVGLHPGSGTLTVTGAGQVHGVVPIQVQDMTSCNGCSLNGPSSGPTVP